MAGWIVAGGLVAAAGVILLVDTFRKKGAKAAKQEALSRGYPMDFANEYAKLATASLSTVEKRKSRATSDFAKRKADLKKAEDRLKAKPNSKTRKRAVEREKKKLGQVVDVYNAASVVLGLKVTTPSEPLIAGDVQTVPEVVQERGALGDAWWDLTQGTTGMYLLGGAVVLLGAGGLYTVWSRR